MKDARLIFVLGSFVAACSAKVDRLPAPGESLRAESFILEAGGKGLNLAAGAARLGARVDGLFAIGRDMFGDFAAAELARLGLEPDMLLRTEGPTGAGIGFVDAHGENCIAVHAGANDLLSRAHVEAASSRLLLADLVAAQFEIADEPIARAFALAAGAGIATILNPSPFRPIDGAILRNTRILVMNRLEAQQMAANLGVAPGGRASYAQVARLLFEEGVVLVVVTAGAEGATAWSADGEVRHQPAFGVTPVDSIGAGDAFLAGLATGIMARRSLSECLRRGSACGALATMRTGVLASLPTGERLSSFLSEAE